MRDAVEFDLRDLDWDDADAKTFAAALGYAHGRGGLQHVQKINLVRNRIGDDGMRALAEVLRAGAMPLLQPRAMVITFNPASKRAQDELRNAMRQRKKRGKQQQAANHEGEAQPVYIPSPDTMQRFGDATTGAPE